MERSKIQAAYEALVDVLGTVDLSPAGRVKVNQAANTLRDLRDEMDDRTYGIGYPDGKTWRTIDPLPRKSETTRPLPKSPTIICQN